MAYYWDNKPYLIKLIINKIKDDIESAKKTKKIKSNKSFNQTSSLKNTGSFISNISSLSSDKTLITINEQAKIKTEDNNYSISKNKTNMNTNIYFLMK